jgi:membrane protein
MLSQRRHPPDPPTSNGRALASLFALLGIAFATEVLFPAKDEHSAGSLYSGVPSPDADGRGRQATTPLEIPARGWKDILLRVYSNISKHRMLALAAGMTYYTILAIFPAVAALVAVYGLFSDPTAIARHLDQLGGFLPGGAIDVAREQLTQVASKGSQTLGLTFLAGIALSVWSANAAIKSLFDTLNIVHDEEEKRGFLKLNAISLLFAVGGVMFVVAALGSIVVVQVILNYVGFSDWEDLLLRLGRWPAMFLVLALALAIIYRYGPNRQAPQWRWVTRGSAIAALMWLIVSGLFSCTRPASASSMKLTGPSVP